MNALGSEETADIVQMRTALYRHYDADGALLYVGISLSPMARTGQHSMDACWFDSVSSISIEWHENRSAALDAECIAINFENPRHNVKREQGRLKALVCWLHEGPKHQGMNTASEIIETVGREAMQAHFDVQPRVLRHYAKIGRLPAAWFDLLERLTGQTLPRNLFSFKGLEQ
jgi:hypothetical protein